MPQPQHYLCTSLLMTSPNSANTNDQGARPTALTIGTFDGVHLGHRTILEELKRHATALGGETVVVTFEPHPRQILQPDVPIQILTPLEDKLELLYQAGIDRVSVTPFTHSFAQLSAEEYVKGFLVSQFHPEAIVIGYDHHFGHDRCGNIALLQSMSETLGFSVHEIPAKMIADAAVSSTKIRTALLSGDVGHASEMLGRNYSISGTVVHGEKLGRTLGYPTANVAPKHATQLIPAQGIYAAHVVIGQETFPAMLSIGTRPTVSDSGHISIEAYLFDFDRDIYDADVSIQFIERMRDELKFESLEALKLALKDDERVARSILGI
jgi:riboflavin kinase/FMN adenylyltransferase